MPLSARTSISASVGLNVAIRWSDRIIGFLSTIILARLLVPADFGIVAQASLVIGLLHVFLDLGVTLALLQNAEPTPQHYDTAWTMRLGQTIFAAAVLFVVAPYAGQYFHEQRTIPVIQVLGAGLVIGALENIGIVTFQKEMRFGLDFQFMFIRRLSGFLLTIVLAIIWHSYWALVLGTLGGRVIGVVLSYQMHSMRPRISIAHFRELFHFSQWAIVRSVGIYFNNEFHRLLVGGRASTGIMGAYTLANEISAMPSNELLAPLNRALLPAFVDAKKDQSELNRLFLLAQGVQTLIVIPASIGLALVATNAITVLLGRNWLSAAPFLQALAIAQVVNAVITSAGYAIVAIGKIRSSATIAWAQLLTFAALSLIIFPHSSPLELAWLRCISVVPGLVVALWILRDVLPGMRVRTVIGTVSRPTLGTLVMCAAVVLLDQSLAAPPAVALAFEVALGATVYCGAVLIFWNIAGKPVGPETYLLSKVIAVWRHLVPSR